MDELRNRALAASLRPGDVEGGTATISNLGASGVDAFTKRYPKAVARNFDGKPGIPTEMDALVAYLQMLGTLVDFKLYNEKANLR